MLTGSKGFGGGGEGRFGVKGQKGSGYQMLEQHLHPAKVCTTEAAGRRCLASPILSQKENARRDRIEFTLHEKAWGGRRKSCSFDMRVPFGCCSRLHLTNPTGSRTIYRSYCLSFFLFFSFSICKMKQVSLKGDRASAAWHSRGLVNHPWMESSCHVVDQSRRWQSKKHKPGE